MRSQRKKDAKNVAEYEEPLVTYGVQSYLNILKCGRNLLKRLDVTYERACMVTPKKNNIRICWKL